MITCYARRCDNPYTRHLELDITLDGGLELDKSVSVWLCERHFNGATKGSA